MSDNFDLRKYLIENKVTTNSKLLKEARLEPNLGIPTGRKPIPRFIIVGLYGGVEKYTGGESNLEDIAEEHANNLYEKSKKQSREEAEQAGIEWDEEEWQEEYEESKEYGNLFGKIYDHSDRGAIGVGVSDEGCDIILDTNYFDPQVMRRLLTDPSKLTEEERRENEEYMQDLESEFGRW